MPCILEDFGDATVLGNQLASARVLQRGGRGGLEFFEASKKLTTGSKGVSVQLRPGMLSGKSAPPSGALRNDVGHTLIEGVESGDGDRVRDGLNRLRGATVDVWGRFDAHNVRFTSNAILAWAVQKTVLQLMYCLERGSRASLIGRRDTVEKRMINPIPTAELHIIASIHIRRDPEPATEPGFEVADGAHNPTGTIISLVSGLLQPLSPLADHRHRARRKRATARGRAHTEIS